MIRFTKATPETGVEAHFKADDPRVLVKPTEFPVPLMPEDGEAYWHELVHTCDCAHMAHEKEKFDGDGTRDWAACMSPVLNNEDATVSTLLQEEPFKVRRCDEGAELVFDDLPADIFIPLLKTLLKDGATFRNILPEQPGLRFTDGIILAHSLIGQAPFIVSPSAFCAKWHFMAPRPEEVLFEWATEALEVPKWVDDSLHRSMNAEKIRNDITASTLYPGVGSPPHPSYPAMHGAAAGVGVLFPVLMNLTEAQHELVRRTIANIAYFRSFANVHLPQDNRAGLWVGEEAMIRWLPDELAKFGADPIEVSQIAQEARSGWLT